MRRQMRNKMNSFKMFCMALFLMMAGSSGAAFAEEENNGAAKVKQKLSTTARHSFGVAMGTRSYLSSAFFESTPGLDPSDMRGNSYNFFYENNPTGYFGFELLISVDPSSTRTDKGVEHSITAWSARFSGKFHPLSSTYISRYVDFYIGGGATGVSLSYETRGHRGSYKAFGPHAMAGLLIHLGRFSNKKWGWGAYFDYVFTPFLNVERVGPEKKDFNAGGHLFMFGFKINAFN